MTTGQREERVGLEHGMNVVDGYAKNYKKVKKTEHRDTPAFALDGERRAMGDMGGNVGKYTGCLVKDGQQGVSGND